MDLRAEPIVLTVPVIEKERYFSVQLVTTRIPLTSTGLAVAPPATTGQLPNLPNRTNRGVLCDRA